MKVLEIDIETAPHLVFCWGLFKQNISLKQIVEPTRMLCFDARWQDKKEHMFFSEHSHSRKAMVRALHKLLDEADAVLHYNGKRFDIPHINREFADVGLNPPSPYKQIDLLAVVRSNFRMASNKLQHVAEYFDLGSKNQTGGFELWLDCMEGCPKAWRKMERYNKQDVVLLRDLYYKLQPWIKSHPNRGLYVADTSTPTCPTCASQNLRIKAYRPAVTRVSWYPQYLCKNCGTYSRGRKAIKRDITGILS